MRASACVGVVGVVVVVAVNVVVGCSRATVAPLQNSSDRGSSSAEEPIVDEAEWRLLREVAREEAGSLSALASFYQQHGAWDEYAAVRTRMLLEAEVGLGPAPGGPFPRIGAPRAADAVAPRTVLSRWVNRAVLPELYAAQEPTLDALEHKLGEALTSAAVGYEAAHHVRLADLLCVRLRFAEAAKHYDAAIVAHRAPQDVDRARARLGDVRRIVRPGADNIADTPQGPAP